MNRYLVIQCLALAVSAGSGLAQTAAEAGNTYALVQTESVHGWTLSAGSNIPAANLGTLEAVGDGSGGLRLGYIFHPEVDYIGIEQSGDWEAGMQAIHFDVDSGAAEQGVLLITDGAGETFLTRWQSSGNGRERLQLILDEETFAQSWGGDENGVIAQPISRVLVGVSKLGPQRGSVIFSDFRYDSTGSPPTAPAGLSVSTNAPSSIFLDSEAEKILRIQVHNRLAEEQGYTVRIESGFVSVRSNRDEISVTVPGYGNEVVQFPIPYQYPGYIAFRITLLNADADGAETPALDTASHAVAIVSTEAGKWPVDSEGFFGMCFMEDLDAARRMGVRFVRDLVHWKYVELQPGRYYTRSVDRLLEDPARTGVGVILTAVMRESPKWAAFQDPSGFLEPNNALYFTGFLQMLAERMKQSQVEGALEIQNEPDIALMWLHKMKLEEATTVAAHLMKEGYRAVKAVYPELPVLGLGMSGMDFRADLELTKGVLETHPFYLDHLAPHPYAEERYAAEGRTPEWPDSGYLVEHWQAVLPYAQTATLGGEIWSTELGWGVEIGIPLLSRHSRDLAGILAQAMILSKASEGVKKFTWFAGQLNWLDEEYDYSIFRQDKGSWYPTPAVSAFATTARFLEAARFIDDLAVHDRMHALLFADQHSDRVVVALWSKTGRVRISGETAERFRTCTIYGAEESVRGEFSVEVGRAPVYFYANSTDAVSMVSALESLRVEHLPSDGSMNGED